MAQEEAMKKKPADELITRGRLEMVYKGSFSAEMVMGLQPLIIAEGDTEGEKLWQGSEPTMATDGRFMYISEKYLRTISFKQMLYVFVHEGMHKALCHPTRMRGMPNHKLANVCADVIVNHMCDELASIEGLERPPEGIFVEAVHQHFRIPKGFTWKDLPTKFSVEELYQLFIDKSGEDGAGKIKKPGWGYVIEPKDGQGNDLSDAELDQIGVEQIIETAAAAERANSRKAGSVPGSLQSMIDKMRKPRIDWRTIMHDFMIGGKPTRPSYQRLNKRYRNFAKLPAYTKRQLGVVVVFKDTSGSVSDHWQEVFLGAMNILSTQVDFEEIITVPVDYAVHESGIQSFKSGQKITTSRVDGRGGTSFIPAFEWLDNHPEIKPYRVIYMTDMEGAFPSHEYKVPTLWVATTNIVAPWGKTINISNEERR